MRWTRRSPADESKAASDRGDRGLIRFMLILAVLAWAVRSLVAAPFSIPSGSMLPTLFVGDYLLVAKWPYGYSRFSFPFHFPPFEGRILAKLPRRGDVAVFRPPGAEIDYVKRVIGLPGDRVEVRGGTLYLNGRRAARDSAERFAMPISANSRCKVVPPASQRVAREAGRDYCLYFTFRETLPGGPSYRVIDQVESARADDFSEIRVPPGHIFLMGDNRDDSLDSRFSPVEGGIGLVPVENLVGRALMTFWSTDGSAVYWQPWTWFSALRGERVGRTDYGTTQ